MNQMQENPIPRRRKRRRHPVVWLIAALLVVLLAVIIIVGRSLRSRPEPPPVDPHAGQIYVNDGANMVWLTPIDGVAVNPLLRSDFIMLEGHPHYMGTDFTVERGVDLSTYQSGINWKAASEEMDFAILRIGYRGYTKGALRPDDAFESHYAGARKNGVDVGVYFFSQALTAQEGREEAEYVLSLLDGRDLQLPIYFDWEDVSAEDARTYGYDYANLTDSAAAFCDTIRDAGYEAGVYINRQQGYYHYDMARLAPYGLWVADLNFYPDFYYAHELWQYTFTAQIDGISGPVDMNLRFIEK
ncbi:MAG: glycoside hydrolase family 25 protein [Oscillospiraceae bacterium]|nr:glycoside hydrolase family 25 protein [Oscillospiraceae bacterium]